MYSRQQASELRHAFWTTFGQYMSPIPSSNGEKINWINYKTGEKHISFRMNADQKCGYIAIELTHPDAEIQQLYFDLFGKLKKLMHTCLDEEWNWQLHAIKEGKRYSRIYKEMRAVNIFNKEHWPLLISFFKPRIIALDNFWNGAKYAFEELK
jgi:hypothetical protein